MSQKEAPPFETWSEKDINTLELELDNGIDALFVPANRKTDGRDSRREFRADSTSQERTLGQSGTKPQYRRL